MKVFYCVFILQIVNSINSSQKGTKMNQIEYVTQQAKEGFLECEVPRHMWEGALRYLLNGIPPGGFLTAVLENNLTESIRQADSTNLRSIVNWARWVYNWIPTTVHGSPKNVHDHIMAGGYEGICSDNAVCADSAAGGEANVQE